MAIKVKVNTILIKDTNNTGEVYIVRTVRTAREIAGYIQESEKDEITDKDMEAAYEK